MRKREHILLAEDDSSLRRVVEYNLQTAGYEVSVAADGAAAWSVFQDVTPELVVTDLAMPKMDGTELLQRVKRVAPDTEVVVITAHGTVDRAVEAMKAGAFDFITKPFEFDLLLMTVERALEQRSLRQENLRLHEELHDRFRPENVVGVSAGMQRVFDFVARVAKTDTNVLILGESGTGKEVIARAIHHHSARRDEPFVGVNCGALPHDLVESELFGVRQGAFTGADQDRPGRFERAGRGTLFLDEITDLGPSVQVKLLRALQEREIEPLGGDKSIAIDARFVFATNADIEKLVADGRFRKDLYFRVNVVTIRIPPLRSRSEDIEPLVQTFLARFGAADVQVDQAAIAALKRYSWPGNVRELENAIERALVLRTQPKRLTADDLPLTIATPGIGAGATTASLFTNAPGSGSLLPENGIDFSAWEKSLLEQALDRAKGNRSQAARLLGMSRQTLLYRLRKFGIASV